jgi:hypothetical protein
MLTKEDISTVLVVIKAEIEEEEGARRPSVRTIKALIKEREYWVAEQASLSY